MMQPKPLLTLHNIIFYNERLIDDFMVIPLVLFCYFMEQYTGLYSSAFIWIWELF